MGTATAATVVVMPGFRTFAVFYLAKGQGSGLRFQINLGINVGPVYLVIERAGCRTSRIWRSSIL